MVLSYPSAHCLWLSKRTQRRIFGYCMHLWRFLQRCLVWKAISLPISHTQVRLSGSAAACAGCILTTTSACTKSWRVLQRSTSCRTGCFNCGVVKTDSRSWGCVLNWCWVWWWVARALPINLFLHILHLLFVCWFYHIVHRYILMFLLLLYLVVFTAVRWWIVLKLFFIMML